MQKVSTYESTFFNRYDRRYQWDTEEVLLCDRKARPTEGSALNHPGSEVITFSSNRPILLGEIHVNVQLLDAKVSMEIVESRMQNTSVEPVTVYRDAFQAEKLQPLIIRTYKPVLIKPNIRYEVRVRMKKKCAASKCTPIVALKNDIIIEFHRNMALSYDNTSNGCISALGFNPIL